LNQDAVLKMSVSRRPELKASANGKSSIVYAPFGGDEYITYDSCQNSPPGFGVRVGKTGKTYIVQRAVNGKVTEWVIGKVGDLTIDEAREKARAGIQISIKKRRHADQSRARAGCQRADIGRLLRRLQAVFGEEEPAGQRRIRQGEGPFAKSGLAPLGQSGPVVQVD
jgi:hypothetical protein